MAAGRPWREVAVPHEDVQKGTFQQAEFAADLNRVHAGSAAPEYQDPVRFFDRTYITEGMRLLLESVAMRLAGMGGDPVIQLQTAFGGGKTHTLLAVHHMASGTVPARELLGVAQLLEHAGVAELPKARVAVLDGNALAPNQPKDRGGLLIRTLWGELAWQLWRREGYALVREADESGTSPGKDVLGRLLERTGPCVILIDELVAYVRQFEDGRILAGGTFDSNLSFLQALTEAMKAAPRAVLLASLPESDREAGSQQGIKALRALEHYFGRVQAVWKPVVAEESFQIVRRRLFEPIVDRTGLQATCKAFSELYAEHKDDFPGEAQTEAYRRRMENAYPIHPEFFDHLYDSWSALDTFQRTRGVLKLMARVIHRLWVDNNSDAMILPGCLPLYAPEVRTDAITPLGTGWDPVIDRDVDGEQAETTSLDRQRTAFGAVQASRRVARALFLATAPNVGSESGRGISTEHVLLGVAQPGQAPAVFKDALKALTDRLHHLNTGNGRYWLETRTNLRREMEERKRRYSDAEDVLPYIKQRIERVLGNGPFRGGVHVFTPSADVPDDWALRLVVLPPATGHARTGASPAAAAALDVLRNRGDQPRAKQNRLIFLAADGEVVVRLKDQVRTVLAWQSIVEDAQQLRIVLDNLQLRQAQQTQEQARNVADQSVREAYKWLLVPGQDATPGKGVGEVRMEPIGISPSAKVMIDEIGAKLAEGEFLIDQWAPIHLNRYLSQWFWKPDAPAASALDFWQKSCQYLYLPRLLNSDSVSRTVALGTGSRDFYGVAQGRRDDGSYFGFSFGESTTPILDQDLLLIEPAAAKAYADAHPPSSPVPAGPRPVALPPGQPGTVAPALPATATGKRVFFGSVKLDPNQAGRRFSDIADEVLQHFRARADTTLDITVEIRAQTTGRFDEALQRTVRENCTQLRFRDHGFED